jgi:SAM-dependent methyltransferase
VKITNCRACQSDRFEKIVDLGFHPLADTFLPASLQYGPEVAYPLQLGLCQSCGHVFSLFAVSAEDRYTKQDYSYDSSNSKVSIQHFKSFSQAILSQIRLPCDALIVDIGSNVGTLLSHFKDSGYKNVVGVEPSGNIAALAVAAGVPTLNEFFDAKAATELSRLGGVDVLLSSNVVNHTDDVVGVLRTAKRVLSPTGVFVFEVPYLLDLVRSTAFDTIYHEHVHYYGIKPLARCLQQAGFSIFKVERLDYMCGSIRVYCRVGGETAESVARLVSEEEAFGLYQFETYESFMKRVRAAKFAINEHLWRIRAEGGKIIGIGAATKGNTLLNYCRLDQDLISYITDASPLKIGKRTPGSHIPIVADTDIDRSATHALILPWNIAPFLKDKLSHLGLQFYVPQVETLAAN